MHLVHNFGKEFVELTMSLHSEDDETRLLINYSIIEPSNDRKGSIHMNWIGSWIAGPTGPDDYLSHDDPVESAAYIMAGVLFDDIVQRENIDWEETLRTSNQIMEGIGSEIRAQCMRWMLRKCVGFRGFDLKEAEKELLKATIEHVMEK